jgi:NTE family protein
VRILAGRGGVSVMPREKHMPEETITVSRRDAASAAREVQARLRGLKKTHKVQNRPPFDCIALLLQGGGALGAYQAGVYEALAEANIHPDWVVGISIGGINSAIIAGNARENRVAKLRQFWNLVTSSPLGVHTDFGSWAGRGDAARDFANRMAAATASLMGVTGFYAPRMPSLWFQPPGTIEATSFYDTSPLKTTLESVVDFDRINSGRNDIRLSLGAVNVQNGELVYFDDTTDVIRVEHVMASGALPPGFPAVEIDGKFYWDGGVISNTPLMWLARHRVPDTLAFQVDLWAAPGAFPSTLAEVNTRMKEILNSSRTAYYTTFFKDVNQLSSTIARYLEQLPDELKQSDDAKYLMSIAKRRLHHLVNLVYRPKIRDSASKEFEFSRRTMEDRWRAGYQDTVDALRHPEVLERAPGHDSGIFIFDFGGSRE